MNVDDRDENANIEDVMIRVLNDVMRDLIVIDWYRWYRGLQDNIMYCVKG